ncbi:hypothetical protein RG959_15675 [Domibacillus sp. 8LH]
MIACPVYEEVNKKSRMTKEFLAGKTNPLLIPSHTFRYPEQVKADGD